MLKSQKNKKMKKFTDIGNASYTVIISVTLSFYPDNKMSILNRNSFLCIKI